MNCDTDRTKRFVVKSIQALKAAEQSIAMQRRQEEADLDAKLFVHLLYTRPTLFPQAAALVRKALGLLDGSVRVGRSSSRPQSVPRRSVEVAKYCSREVQRQVMRANLARKYRALYAERAALKARLDAQCCAISATCFPER